MLTEMELDAIADRLVTRLEGRLCPKVAELVSRTEIARRLKVSLPTIDRMATEGRIPSQKIGSRRLFDVGEVMAAIREQSDSDSLEDDDA